MSKHQSRAIATDSIEQPPPPSQRRRRRQQQQQTNDTVRELHRNNRSSGMWTTILKSCHLEYGNRPHHNLLNIRRPLSPLEHQVKVLLQGDLTYLNESLREVHDQIVHHTTTTTNRRPLSSGTYSRCPEYEHFRTIMHHRRKRQRQKLQQQHPSYGYCPDYENGFESVGGRSISSSLWVCQASRNDGGDESLESITKAKIPKKSNKDSGGCGLLPNNDAQRQGTKLRPQPEYAWFRAVMQEKQETRHWPSYPSIETRTACPADNDNISDSDNLSWNRDCGITSIAADEDIREIASRKELETHHSSHWRGSELEDCPKQLGEVRELLGTVLGKAPPSHSPFYYRGRGRSDNSFSGSSGAIVGLSDVESIELVFDD